MSVLSDAAAALGAGSWVQLNTLNFNDSVYRAGYNRVTDYGTQIFWDSINRRVWFAGGPAHGETNKVFYYSENSDPPNAANTWRVAWSGEPDTAHQYGRMALRKDTGDPYRISGRQVQRFTGSGWENFGSQCPAGTNVYNTLQWFPELAEFWSYNCQTATPTLYRMPASTGNWTQVSFSPGSVGGPYSPFSCYTPVTKYLMFGAHDSGSFFWRANESGTVQPATSGPFNLGVQAATIAADPVTGLMLALSSTGAFRAYNPSTSTIAGVGPNAWSGNLPNPYGLRGGNPGGYIIDGGYIDSYGVTMWIDSYDPTGQVYLYKHSPLAVKPPNSPTALRVVP